MNQSPKMLALFSVRYTAMILLWNHCELCARQILQRLLGEGDPSLAIAAEIQNRSLTQALRSISKVGKFSDLQTDIAHFSNGYDTLLAYRNHYVHSLMGIENGVGGMLSLSAKGTLKYSSSDLNLAELVEFCAHLEALIGYGLAIHEKLGAHTKEINSFLKTHQASLEKPHWPKTLQKPQSVILETPSPPQPSEA